MTTVSALMGSGVPAAQAVNTTAGVPLTGLSAAGTTQAGATLITDDFSVFSTVAASSGTRLPASNPVSGTAQAGDIYRVVNSQATNALAVYPPIGGNFSGVAVNTAVNVAASRYGEFLCLGGNVWAASLSA